MAPRSLRGISREHARAVDLRASGELRIPSICLMENAGSGAARIAMERWKNLAHTAVCLCGPGQNGGDALVVARHLAVAGGRPRILAIGNARGFAPQGDAGVNLAICRAMGLRLDVAGDPGSPIPLEEVLGSAGILVDGLFGTGLSRPVEGMAATVVLAANASDRPILALDLPSGLDCDTGIPLGPCIRAEVTATFVAPKLGFSAPGARAWTGEVVVVGIGAPLD